jgi:hypothetical protein
MINHNLLRKNKTKLKEVFVYDIQLIKKERSSKKNKKLFKLIQIPTSTLKFFLKELETMLNKSDTIEPQDNKRILELDTPMIEEVELVECKYLIKLVTKLENKVEVKEMLEI